MDKHPENTETTPQDDQIIFPELTQEQIVPLDIFMKKF